MRKTVSSISEVSFLKIPNIDIDFYILGGKVNFISSIVFSIAVFDRFSMKSLLNFVFLEHP